MKTFLLSISLTILCLASIGQKQNFSTDYTLTTCKGDIPLIYKTSITQSIADYPEKELEDKYYQDAFYSLDNLMRSGRISFGDEITVYMNKVLQNLLEKSGKTKLKKELKVYLLKTSKINYYSMIDGSIIISVGLISQLENEAQLAFMLAHEITHYEKRHDEDTYTENKELILEYIRMGGTLKNFRKDLRKNMIEKEVESDEFGIKIYRKAGYSVDQAKAVLQVLKYSLLPFDDIEFDKTFFNRKNYTIPVSFFYLDKKENEDDDDDDDMGESVIDARIDGLESEKNNKGKIFNFDEKEFTYINTKAKFENQHLNLVERRFVRAIYESYVLKKQFPKNKFLDETIAKGLYGMSKIKNFFDESSISAEELIEVEPEEKAFKDESMPLWNLLSNMTMKELNILATKMIIELDDEAMKPYLQDLMKDLVMDMNFDYEDFYTTEVAQMDTIKTASGKDSIVSTKKEFKILTDKQYDKLSKVEKIVYTQKKAVYDKQIALLDSTVDSDELEIPEMDEEYYLSAFITELQDTSFANDYDRYSKDDTYRYYSDYYDDLSYAEQKKIDKANVKRNKKTQAYGLDSIIIYQPYYYYEDRYSAGDMNVPKNLVYKKSWINSLTSSTKFFNLKTLNLIHSFNYSPTLEKLNMSFLISTWNKEIKTTFKLKMLPMMRESIHNLMDETGYNKIMFSGMISDPSGHYKYIRVLDKNGYIEMSKYARRGKPKKDDKFIKKVVAQIAAVKL